MLVSSQAIQAFHYLQTKGFLVSLNYWFKKRIHVNDRLLNTEKRPLKYEKFKQNKLRESEKRAKTLRMRGRILFWSCDPFGQPQILHKA